MILHQFIADILFLKKLTISLKIQEILLITNIEKSLSIIKKNWVKIFFKFIKNFVMKTIVILQIKMAHYFQTVTI